jgi:hypothetical protein
VTPELWLLPNLGGEEGGDWRRHLREPRVAAAARLWRLLFPASVGIVGTPNDPLDWPAELDETRHRAAFAWLEPASGCVPWLATREANAEAQAEGLALAGPGAEIVERVHDKAFALRTAESEHLVPPPLRGTAHVFEPAELTAGPEALRRMAAAVAGWPAWTRGRFTLKPRHGSSGRGRVDGCDGRRQDERLRAALPRLAARGGAILEPWLERTRDFSVQIDIGERGVAILGSLELLVGAAGTYVGHRGEVDTHGEIRSGSPHDAVLREAAVRVAEAAWRAGFRGPASVDAFAFRLRADDEPHELLRPVVELNARFTMGTVAIGLLHRARSGCVGDLDLQGRHAFAFLPGATAVDEEQLCEAGGSARVLPLASERATLRPLLLVAADRESVDAGLAGAGTA